MIQESRVPQARRDAYTLQATATENVKPVETYRLHDAETIITFSQDDHPPAVPRPGHAPLVLDAQIGGYDMDRIFMDGGSSMNIIFASTLQKMLIPRSVWKKSSTELHGVVPREAATSLGVIVMTSRKVSHYFDEHPITIVSSTPLVDILNNPGATGRVAEWNIELSPRDLQFKHPTAIKAQ